MSVWKHGDVAMVTAVNRRPYRAYLDVDASGGDTWREYGAANSCLNSPTTIRPLVVIDLEDAKQVRRLAEAVNHLGDFGLTETIVGLYADALREFAAPTPPKPDEPQGLGAVVEDAEGIRFVRHAFGVDGQAWCGDGCVVDWSDVDAVRVLSEGVS